MKDVPQIWVADLASYNNGDLRGAWIDATQDPDDIRAEISAMLAESPYQSAEDYAIHDTLNFKGLNIREYDDLEQIARAANLIEEHGAVFAAVVDHVGGLSELDEAEEMMTERYAGEFDSPEDWAAQLAEDGGGTGCREPYDRYVDWEAVARDADLGGDIWTFADDTGKTHVFWTV